MNPIGPAEADLDRMERALGWRPSGFRSAALDRGDAAGAGRWIVANDPNRTAFVKIGTTDLTADWIRREHRVYAALRGWFLPAVFGFDDDGIRPTLALEDLSEATWPPPWSERGVDAVLEALAAIRATRPPDHIPALAPDQREDWLSIAARREPFLSLA